MYPPFRSSGSSAGLPVWTISLLRSRIAMPARLSTYNFVRLSFGERLEWLIKRITSRYAGSRPLHILLSVEDGTHASVRVKPEESLCSAVSLMRETISVKLLCLAPAYRHSLCAFHTRLSDLIFHVIARGYVVPLSKYRGKSFITLFFVSFFLQFSRDFSAFSWVSHKNYKVSSPVFQLRIIQIC